MLVAKGIHRHPQLKLGSIRQLDPRTISLSDEVDVEKVSAPAQYDYDQGKKPAITIRMWGNDEYGDCELAGRANYLMRLERTETKKNPNISNSDVIDLYKQMTGCRTPGDNNDTGLTTVGNLNQWRSGWNIEKAWDRGKPASTRSFSISAYGAVNFHDSNIFKSCIYLFGGALLGCNMPLTAQNQFESGVWDVVNGAGEAGEPGSWGGHCIFIKKYDANNWYVLTWGTEIRVTPAWMEKYCEEAYSVVDNFDSWLNKDQDKLDIQGLIKQMEDVGIKVVQ